MYYGLRGLSLIALPFTNFSLVGLSAFAVFYGLDWVATVPPTVRLTADTFGAEKANLTFGWIFAAHQLGAATAAFGAGLSRTDLSTYLPALYVAGVACLVAAALALTIGRPKAPRRRSRQREGLATRIGLCNAGLSLTARSIDILPGVRRRIALAAKPNHTRKRCRG